MCTHAFVCYQTPCDTCCDGDSVEAHQNAHVFCARLLQPVDGAKALFERRATFLKEKIEQVQPQVVNKVKQKRMVEEVSLLHV